MTKALAEIGWLRAIRFGLLTLAHAAFRALPFPPLRVLALRLLGARIGPNTVIHSIRFFNFDRAGFRALEVGADCFLGDDCLIDLADRVILEDQVTLAERVTLLTHTNVGYRDHPLQACIPRYEAPVTLHRGSFVGAAAVVLPGVEIGPESGVGAGAVVTESVPTRTVVAGVPARVVRRLS